MTDSEEDGSDGGGQQLTKAELDNDANLVLMLGLGSILFGLIGPVAFHLGRKYVNRCKEQDIEPESGAVAGMYFGLVTGIITALLALLACAGFAFFLLVIVLPFVLAFVSMFLTVLFV